jgi:hypothetical protein
MRCNCTALFRNCSLSDLNDMLSEQAKIAITKRWSRGKDGLTKTRKAEGHVPLHPASPIT